jgi:hypothetical protein
VRADECRKCLGGEYGSCASLVGMGTGKQLHRDIGCHGWGKITEKAENVGVGVKGYRAGVLGVWGEGSTECGQKVRRCDVDGGASG